MSKFSSQYLALALLFSQLSDEDRQIILRERPRPRILPEHYGSKYVRRIDTGEQIKSEKIGRNDLCPCGSGKKYKRCCLDKQNQQEKKEKVNESL